MLWPPIFLRISRTLGFSNEMHAGRALAQYTDILRKRVPSKWSYERCMPVARGLRFHKCLQEPCKTNIFGGKLGDFE